jgi:hypothetical protein
MGTLATNEIVAGKRGTETARRVDGAMAVAMKEWDIVGADPFEEYSPSCVVRSL